MEKRKGTIIEVNGAELYYEKAGKVGNKPVIVFESGYGWRLENWDVIRKELEKSHELFFYDRPGVGRSSKSNDQPLHSLQTAHNLKELLHKVGVRPPYLLVGHSFGGVNVRLFAHLYPEDTAGIILLDSCHEDQNRKMVPLFTPEVRCDYLGQFTVEASLAEFEESLEQVRGTVLGKLPLLVLTGGNQPHHTEESMAEWHNFQTELARLSPDSKHRIIDQAGHAIHLDAPAIVIAEIKEMNG